MSDANIADLIQVERFPRGWQILPICFYFPLGLVLSVLRLFIGLNALVASCVLPRMSFVRSFVFRVMCVVLGIVVQEENTKEKDEDAKVVITNHLSIFDHLALDLVFPCIMPSVWDFPHVINWCLGYKDFSAKNGKRGLVENLKKHLRESNCSILIHPEGTVTNGTVGLLKFSSWPFSLERTVKPVAIRIHRPPPFFVSVTVAGSHWWSDIFWLFFTPVTFFTLSYLPTMAKEEYEEDEEFSKRVQDKIAAELKLKITSISVTDVQDYIKRNLIESRRTTTERHEVSTTEENSEISRMALQVKEVLPYVPLEIIKQDLFRTGSVDLTVTNILEGLVPFVSEFPVEGSVPLVPELQPERSTVSLRSSVTSARALENNETSAHRDTLNEASAISSDNSALSDLSAASEFSTAASYFGKTADERMQSFEERKQQLLEFARRRYIEKHRLN